MYDKEIEALAKCSELIKELEDDEKMRVIQYLIAKFDIWVSQRAIKWPSQVDDKILSNSSYSMLDSEKTDEYPSIKNLVIKDLPKGEAEWVLIYWFYSSWYWNNSFTRDDIMSKYDETNRKTVTRRKNLSQSIEAWIKKDWFKAMNNKDFIMLPWGISYCNDIINWNSVWTDRKTSKRKQKPNTN